MTNATPPSETPAKKSVVRRFITPVLATVAALAIGLFGGILIGHGTASTPAQGDRARVAGAAPGGIGGPSGDLTAGTITGIDGDRITLKLADGSSVTVTSNSDTTVTTSKKSSVSDLAKGDAVTVSGTKESDGTVSATSVREGESGFGGGTRPTQ
jgi:hypothetical protein